MVGSVRDLSSTLPRTGKLIKQVVRKYGYWVVEPDIHIFLAPINNGNDLQGKGLCIFAEMPEGINLFYIPLWVQMMDTSRDPIVGLVL